MCLCKEHLHARWAIAALLKLTKKQEINIDFDSYESFFRNDIYSECILPDESSEYIKWTCTPSRNSICNHISTNFQKIKCELLTKSNNKETVNMLHFVKRMEKTKKGKWVKRLKAEAVHANIPWVLNFIESFLPQIIHHRNLLKNYRTNIDTVMNAIDNVAELGMDFSENITIPVHKEPQSLYWGGCKEEKTVHSGLSKSDGGKTYHVHISDDMVHNQAFVKIIMKDMLDHISVQPGDTVIMCSDNCTSQYKSSQHFHDLRTIAKCYNIKIVRIYGIPGHGKNEIDTVGGTQKIALRRAVAQGKFFSGATSCVEYLNTKFGNSEAPTYNITELFEEQLQHERRAASKYNFPTVPGSSSIRIMIVQPDSDEIKAAPYLCICEKCLVDYGSCNLFSVLQLDCTLKKYRKPCTRGDMVESANEDDDDQNDNTDDEESYVAPSDYDVPDTICAVAPEEGSDDLFYFIYIVESSIAEMDMMDHPDYGHVVQKDEEYVSGYYLEKHSETCKGKMYSINKKKDVFFFKESIIYPFMNFTEVNGKKKRMFLSNEDYCDLLHFVDETKMAMIV